MSPRTAPKNDFLGGDTNWVGTKAMQNFLQANAECETENDCGKQHMTRRDEMIWSAWPKFLHTLSPRAGCGSWTTRKCWRSGTRSRCDYLLVPREVISTGYENIPTKPEVSTDHEMIVARCRLQTPPATRRRRWRSARPKDMEVWRKSVDTVMKKWKEEEQSFVMLDKWDEIIEGGGGVGYARARAVEGECGPSPGPHEKELLGHPHNRGIPCAMGARKSARASECEGHRVVGVRDGGLCCQ